MPATRPVSDCVEQFKTLPAKLGVKFLRRAGKKAATVILDEARERAPRRTGLLEDTMALKTKKESDTEITISIGPSKQAFYGRYVDQGTKNMSARPFLNAAADSKAVEASTTFGEELNSEIEDHFNV